MFENETHYHEESKMCCVLENFWLISKTFNINSYEEKIQTKHKDLLKPGCQSSPKITDFP